MELNSPVVASAAAVSALVLSEQHGSVLDDANLPDRFDAAYQGDLSELIVGSAHWLARQQRDDGGFRGAVHPEDSSLPSSLPTTILVRSAFQLTGAPAAYRELIASMNTFIDNHGGLAELRKGTTTGKSSHLLVHGVVGLTETLDCHDMPAIPIETAIFNQGKQRDEFWSNRGSMMPALVAMGLASFHAYKPMNPITSWRRGRAYHRAFNWLAAQQQENGGFAGSVPATSIIIMSLASIAQSSSPVVRRGVEFLFANLTEEGYWRAGGSLVD